ncbi:hypothetical protein MRB53_008941 [Persea americana]|uniref:Uncharacterized protein n=1 Tax=Persea americana TaxID=3435 RepID=A0ACC2LMK1_PERAE|nr:hypothetical protein MRB53_008941 [Persea americana]
MIAVHGAGKDDSSKISFPYLMFKIGDVAFDSDWRYVSTGRNTGSGLPSYCLEIALDNDLIGSCIPMFNAKVQLVGCPVCHPASHGVFSSVSIHRGQ